MTGREEGIITRLLDNDLIEVAIDNDFTIPVMRREVVVVAPEEAKAFGQNAGTVAAERKAASTGAARAAKAAGVAPAPEPGKSGAVPTSAVPAKIAKGLYLALVHQSPELLAVHVVNNTDADVLYTFGEERPDNAYRGLASDKLSSKEASKPLGHWHLKDFDKWPAVLVQLLPHQVNGATAYELLSKRLQFRAATFYKSRQQAPVLQKEAYLFQLDEKPAAPVAPPAPENLAATLQAQLSGDAPAKPAAPAPVAPAKALVAPPHELDLHLDALRPEGAADLSNTAMLKLQMDTFEDALSRALATNMHEIVFIHGAGNGTLRKEIHKQLSRNKDIKFFEDAQKEKFGYGATLVRLK